MFVYSLWNRSNFRSKNQVILDHDLYIVDLKYTKLKTIERENKNMERREGETRKLTGQSLNFKLKQTQAHKEALGMHEMTVSQKV